MICFAPGKLCFQLREIDFATENSLPARGWKTPPKSSFFTGATVARAEIWLAKDFRDTFARKQGRSGHFGEGKWRFIARIRLQDSPFSVDFRRLKMQNLGHSEPVFEAFSVPISPRNGTFIAGNSAPVYALTPARRGRRASWGGRPSGGRRRSLRTAKRWYSCGFGPSANRCDERCGRQRSGCVVRQSIFDSKRIVVVKLFAPGFSSQTEDSSYSILYG